LLHHPRQICITLETREKLLRRDIPDYNCPCDVEFDAFKGGRGRANKVERRPVEFAQGKYATNPKKDIEC